MTDKEWENAAVVEIRLKVPRTHVGDFQDAWRNGYAESLIEHAEIESATIRIPPHEGEEVIELERW
jgi:hypothetical protein